MAHKKHAVNGTEKKMRGKVLALVLTCHHMGREKRVDADLVKTDADRRWVGVSKKLLDCDEEKAIRHIRSEARGYLRRHSLPSYLKEGVYLVPEEYIEQVNQRLTEYAHEYEEAVEKLVLVYNEMVKNAKLRLGSLFDQNDYPSKEGLRYLFGLTWSYVSFDVPVSLQQVSKELYAAEQKKAEQSWAEAQKGWQALLRENMKALVNHLVDRLSPAKDGKKKIFRDSAIGNLQEFIDTFNPRNVANDEELRGLVDKTRGLIKGVNPDTLRDDEHARNVVRQSFQTIKNQLDKMVELKPTRAITFED